MIKIEELMTRTPHALSPTNTLDDAKVLMHEKEIRHVPVIGSRGDLLGLVTQRDILSAQESSLHEDSALNSYTMSTPLEHAMRRDVMTVSPQAGLRESATYMQKHRVGCLPVVFQGKLVGIITDTDFVAIAINLLELQEEVEPLADELAEELAN